MLVLHDTSCLDNNQIKNPPNGGVLRVNTYIRIVREAAIYAANKLYNRIDKIRAGNFDAAESLQYINDNIDKVAEITEEIMEYLNHPNFSEYY
jgi:hypothetical protein